MALEKQHKQELLLLNGVFLAYLFFQYVMLTPHFDPDFYFLKMVGYYSPNLTEGHFHFNDMILWWDIMEYTYSWFPNIGWLAGVTALTALLPILLSINLVWFIAHKNDWPRLHRIMPAILILVLALPNLFWMHHNRSAFILTAASLVLFYLVSSYLNRSVRKTVLQVIAIILFIGGVFIRPEAGTSIAIITLFFFYLIRKEPLAKYIQQFSPFIVILLLTWGFYFYQSNVNSSFYYQIEPDLEYEIVDRRNTIPLSQMTNAVDSAKYQAVAHYWMLGDIHVTSPNFMKSLLKSKDYNFVHTLTQIKWSEFKKVIPNNWAVILFLILSTISALVILPFSQSAKLILVNLAGILILSLSFSVSSFARVTEPYLWVLALLNLVFILIYIKDYNTKKRKLPIAIVGLFILITGGDHIKELVRNNNTLCSIEKNNYQLTEALLSMDSERKYVAVFADFSVFNTGAFNTFKGFGDKQLLLPEFGQFSGNIGVLSTQAKISNCEEGEFSCLLEFIKNNKKDMIIVGDKSRLEFISHYMKAVHQKEINLTQGEATPFSNETYIWKP